MGLQVTVPVSEHVLDGGFARAPADDEAGVALQQDPLVPGGQTAPGHHELMRVAAGDLVQ